MSRGRLKREGTDSRSRAGNEERVGETVVSPDVLEAFLDRPLTDEQRQAIATREVSIALSAGAGCGKTFVLTERFLSYLDPAAASSAIHSNVSEVVAITFTEAAAREMRDRVRQRCRARMAVARGSEASAWWQLSRRLNEARINTIHGFCRSLLGAYALEAGFDPRIRVLSDAEANLIRLQVVDDLLRRKLANWDEQVLMLAESGRIEQLRDNLLELASQASSTAAVDWAEATPDELVQAWSVAFQTSLPSAIGRMIAASGQAARVRALMSRLREPNEKINVMRAQLLTLLDALATGQAAIERIADLRAAALVRGLSAKIWSDKKVYASVRDALQQLRNRIDSATTLNKRSLFEFDAEKARPAAEDGLQLLRLAIESQQTFATEKQRLASLDFDDLIEGTIELLSRPENEGLLRQVRGRIFALLVDEFQDTDRRQLELVRLLCGEELRTGKLFVVGDHKQSIYRFRGAEPRVFHELAADLPDAGRQSLTKNFRSQPAILDFVNALFFREFGGDYESLCSSRPQVTPMPAIEFLWTEVAEQAPESHSGGAQHASQRPRRGAASVDELRRCEAQSVARRLRELLDDSTGRVFQSPDSPGGQPTARPLRPGDVAILFRALSDVHFYESALRSEGIDYYLAGGHAFYSQQEIRDIAHLLRAVASEADELSLAGALRSPIFALFDETLYWMVHNAGTLNAGLALASPIKELPRSEQHKVARAASALTMLRSLKDRVSVENLVNAAIERTGYDAILLGEFLGERKLANLYKLVDDARAADASGIDFHGFVTQLSQFIVKLPKERLAATSPESENVVRLMTIHNAKGLEFPLVVLPDLNRQVGGARRSVALHPELGPLVAARPARGEEKLPTVGLDLHSVLDRDLELEESLRVLYVACTRAADYLILSAGIPAGKDEFQGLMATVARNFDLATGECQGDLPEDFTTPEVLVTRISSAASDTLRPTRTRSALTQALEAAGRSDSARGPLPAEVLPLSADASFQREFSFSRLSGILEHFDAETTESELVRMQSSSSADVRGETARHSTGDPSAREDALAVGQLVHVTLEALPVEADVHMPSLVARYAETLLGSATKEHREELAARACAMLSRVPQSDRYREMSRAKQMLREVEFLLPWPPRAEGEHPAPPANASLIRGVIDCIYQDISGRWHLVDYKTNQVTEKDLDSVASRYTLQLQLYALAVQQTLGVAPCELVLWFLHTGREVQVHYNEVARAECIARINQAIAQLSPSQ